MLRIALPNKGRLSEDARELFADAGLEARTVGERALTASLGGEFEAIFVRAQDIPEFVADGAADAGVTGFDLVCESGRDLEVLLDLEFGKCRLVLAVREDSGLKTLSDFTASPRIATVFPGIVSRYFNDAGIPIQLVPLSGATEIAPHLGIADAVADITSTGSTLKVNGLREISTLMHSSARLVRCGPGGRPRTRDALPALTALADALESVLRASTKRYLMANVPREQLAAVKQVLPGLNGPTVVDILNGGSFVAVHAVVPAASVYRTAASLKQLGAQGILVTRIERLMA